MAHPRPFVRVVAQGSMLEGAEVWSCSWTMIGTGAGGFRNTGEMLEGLVATIEFWFTSGSGIHSAADLRTVKANVIDTDGKYASDDETIYYDFPEPVKGSVTGPLPLPQQSVVVSLLTDAQRGRGSRGRFYPPLTIATLDSKGYIRADTVQEKVTAAASLIDGFNEAGEGVWRVGVSSDLGEGVQRRVTRVAVGNVVDVMRSRRNSLQETYTYAAVAP